MPRITFRSGEYIIEDPVRLCGPVPTAVFRLIVPAITVVVIALVLRYGFMATDSLRTNEATKDIPVYRVMSKLYLPILIALVLAMVYYLASLFLEKFVLTNQAIIRRGVFSVTRIERAEITSVEISRQSFNFINAQRQWSFIIGRLLGVSYIVTITAGDEKKLTIRDVSKAHAQALAAGLQLQQPNVG